MGASSYVITNLGRGFHAPQSASIMDLLLFLLLRLLLGCRRLRAHGVDVLYGGAREARRERCMAFSDASFAAVDVGSSILA